MTRRRFPLVDVLVGIPGAGTIGTPLVATDGLRVDLFADPAATVAADAVRLDGADLPSAVVDDNGDGVPYVTITGAGIPPFLGPDDVLTIYGRVNDGAPFPISSAQVQDGAPGEDGADGQDGADGPAGAGAGSPMAVGRYYASPQRPALISTLPLTVGQANFSPFTIGRACTLDRIGVIVTAGGATGAAVRLAIYNDAHGVPGSLVLDAGTVPTTAAGPALATINQVAPIGSYWLAVSARVASSTIIRGDGGDPMGSSTAPGDLAVLICSFFADVPGAFPNPAPATSPLTPYAARVLLRASA